MYVFTYLFIMALQSSLRLSNVLTAFDLALSVDHLVDFSSFFFFFFLLFFKKRKEEKNNNKNRALKIKGYSH